MPKSHLLCFAFMYIITLVNLQKMCSNKAIKTFMKSLTGASDGVGIDPPTPPPSKEYLFISSYLKQNKNREI